jgi:hypothetical protein
MTTATAIAAGHHPTPLVALIRKDLRQYGLLALLGLLVVGGFLVDSVHFVPYFRGRVLDYTNFPLNHASASLLTAMVFPLIAATLGFAQFFFETKPDLWAFFVHRPVSRGTLFGGKVAAGLIMFLTVTVIPYTLAVLWQSDPAHIPAPFDWSLALPGYLDILTALSFYFAAIVVARREARWFGSRIFPLGFPILAAVLVFGTSQLSIALVTSLVAVALTGHAARSVFVAGGFYSPQRAPARFSLGLMVVSGLCLLGGTIVAFIAITLFYEPEYSFRGYRISDNGTLLILEEGRSSGKSFQTCRDLEGNWINLAQDGSFAQTAGISGFNFADPRFHGYRSPDEAYVLLGVIHSDAYFFDTHHNRILVYSTVPHAFLGSLGADGFFPGKLIPGRAFGPLSLTYYERGNRRPDFIAGNAVYRLSQSEIPAVETIYTAPPGETLFGAFRLPSFKEQSERIVVATSDRVVILGLDGTAILDVPLACVRGALLQVARLAGPDRYTFWYDPRASDIPRAGNYEFVTADAATKEISRRTAPDIGSNTDYPEPPALLSFITLAPPAAAAAGIALESLDFYLTGRPYDPFTGRQRRENLRIVEYLALGVVLGVIGTFLLARRHNFSRSRTIAWCLLAVGLGIPAMLLFPFLLDLPARPPCPACKKARSVAADFCPHCGKPFPAPQPTGTEIFEPGASGAGALTGSS